MEEGPGGWGNGNTGIVGGREHMGGKGEKEKQQRTTEVRKRGVD